MPVSMVCETTATVNAALHDSLATNCSGSAVSETANTSSILTPSVVGGSGHGGHIDDERIENKLAASTKRILQAKVDYEEVNNYSQNVLDPYKDQCIVINPSSTLNGYTMANGTNLPATTYNNGHSNGSTSAGQLVNGNGNHQNHGQLNGHVMPASTNGTSGSNNSNNDSNRASGSGGANNSNSNNSSNTNSSNNSNLAMNGQNGGNSNHNNHNNNNNSNSNNNGITKRQNSNSNSNNSELPEPKVNLFPREKVLLGWRGVNRKWKPGAGFLNVGNTCYLNSTLQALFHVPAMANWLCTDALDHMDSCNESESSCIICAVAKTLQASQGNQSAIRPFSICSRMKYICKTLVIGRQEDAHEFLRYLVEGMERCFLQSVPNYKQLDQHSKETTPINQILGGYLKSAVRCLACGHISVTFQHFQDLLLDIRKGDTVEQALDVYFSRERLEDMGYKCESCKKKVSATKQFSLERAPYVLCIQLKRFSMSGAKINKQIQIRTRLDLTKYATRKPSEPLTYRLVSLINHLGSSPNCGHYTAIGLTQSGTYFSFDDSSVYPISLQNICSSNAYIIFYELDPSLVRPEVSNNVMTNGNANNVAAKENYRTSNGPLSERPHSPNSNNSYPQSSGMNTNVNAGLPGYNKPLPLTTNNNSNGLHQANNKPKMVINFIKNSDIAKLGYYPNGAVTPPHAKNNGNYNTNNSNGGNFQNGLMNGSLRFQDLAQMDTSVVSSTNKEKADPLPNINESSFSDSEDELNSIQRSQLNKNSKATLPDMPKLFDGSTTPVVPPKSFPLPSKTTLNTPIKSLQPYFSDTDDETDIDVVENKVDSTSSNPKSSSSSSNSNKQTPVLHLNNNSNHNNRLQKRSASTDSTTSSDSSNNGLSLMSSKLSKGKHSTNLVNGAADHYLGDNNSNPKTPTLASQPCSPSPSSSSVSSTESVISARFSPTSTSNDQALVNQASPRRDSIDEIFNQLKTNSSSSIASHSKTNSNNKYSAKSSEHSSNNKNRHDNTTTNSSMSDLKHNKRIKRSLSTPPSTGMVETKTGVWKVTALNTSSNDEQQPATEQSSSLPKASKNPNNPFASKPLASDTAAKKPKLANDLPRRRLSANGYHPDTAKNNVVDELLKQSHRGYGTSVSSWTGTQTEIEKEVYSEAREQKQRDWDDEEEHEMDRGRQRKIKKHSNHNDYDSYPSGYNPFQVQEDEQRRWRNGGGNMGAYNRYNHKRNNRFKKFQHNNKFNNNHRFNFNKSNHNSSYRPYNNNNRHNGHGSHRRDT